MEEICPATEKQLRLLSTSVDLIMTSDSASAPQVIDKSTVPGTRSASRGRARPESPRAPRPPSTPSFLRLLLLLHWLHYPTDPYDTRCGGCKQFYSERYDRTTVDKHTSIRAVNYTRYCIQGRDIFSEICQKRDFNE